MMGRFALPRGGLMPAVTMPRGRRLRAQSLAGPDELATRPATNPLANSRAARGAHRGAELLGMRLAARAKKIGIEDLEHLQVSLVAGRHRPMVLRGVS
jgi:hypothetical protein